MRHPLAGLAAAIPLEWCDSPGDSGGVRDADE